MRSAARGRCERTAGTGGKGLACAACQVRDAGRCECRRQATRPLPSHLQVLEEAGLHLGALEFAYAVNSVFPSGAHYVTVVVRAQVPADAQPVNCEPHKCEGWEWVSRCGVLAGGCCLPAGLLAAPLQWH